MNSTRSVDRRGARAPLIALVALLLLGAGMAMARPDLGGEVGPPLIFIGYATAGTLFVRRARGYDGREALAWTLIGLGMLVGALGVAVLSVLTVAGVVLPAFGPLDLFFVTAYLLNVAGFWALPHLEGARFRRVRIALDGLVGAVSIAVIAWVAVLEDVLAAVRDAPPWQVVIGSAYPLIDVAILIVVMVVTLRRSTLRFDPRMLLFGVGVSAQALAELAYLSRGVGAEFGETEPFFPALLVATAAFLLAGMLLGTRPPPREYAERRTPWWAMVAPYGAALVLVAMLLFRVVEDQVGLQTLELLFAAVVVVALIMMRQAVAIRENRELVESQRSALVSSISHELRTPLTAMVGFLDILADPVQHIDAEDRREMIDIVHRQTRYMARIVSDLVMLNRAEPDVQLNEELSDVAGTVVSAVASLDVDAAPGVKMEVEPGLVGVYDVNRIQQVLVNLLSNAARYGGPHRLVVAARRGSDLVLEVHDDGPGVPKRYELVIWDKFERGVHRYDAGMPGSGIGLAIVDLLTRVHRGTASYRRSERLGGACFTVTLPDRAREALRPVFATQNHQRASPPNP